jgi:hypothetical protein
MGFENPVTHVSQEIMAGVPDPQPRWSAKHTITCGELQKLCQIMNSKGSAQPFSNRIFGVDVIISELST